MIKWCFLPLGGEKNCRDKLISHIEFSKSELILDMCCGTGGVTWAVLRKTRGDCHIIGIDLSSGQLRQASKLQDLKTVQFIEGDVSNSCFPDNVFDKVLITHALHEMTRDSRLRVLNEAKRIIKKNGAHEF
jgi:ubiquinone/menaquinone biosynthesis C-methylase UbiE